jgi:hypothetical protein
MPLDHYIPQVHLRRFYSPALGNRMYAIRKTDLCAFTPRAQDVCRILDGSTNAYLREERAIEDFLKTVEPNYGAALEKLIAGQIDNECIYTIAGFVAYVLVCSPAGMRINSEPLKSAVETSVGLIEAQGLLPPPPAELGGASLTELLGDGTAEVNCNPKFPQALGIASIRQWAAGFADSKWEILHNDSGDSPFFTSDFPAAIEKTDDPRILNRIVPLAPNLALRIRPDPTSARFGYRRRNPSRTELVMLNRLIVRCAEDTVFYRDDHPWVRPFVSRNRHYRIEPHTDRLPTPTGAFLVSRLGIVPSTPPAEHTGPSAGTTG